MLNRAEEIRERYGRVVLDRPAGTTPADVLRLLVEQDIARFRSADPRLARGEFPAQCLSSPGLRRYALEAREQQVQTVAAALVATCPNLHPIAGTAHAAALIAVVAAVLDQIGACVLHGGAVDAVAADLSRSAGLAFDDLDRCFRSIMTRTPEQVRA